MPNAEQELVPTLKVAGFAIHGNLSHKGKASRRAVGDVGARLRLNSSSPN